MNMLGRKSARITELENLVSQLKQDKRNLRKTLLDFSQARSALMFICKNPTFSKHPYMFVNGRGSILGYTEAFKEILNLSEEYTGRHYLEVFDLDNFPSKSLEDLKKYFSSPERRSVPFDLKVGTKTRHLTVIKEEPIYTERSVHNFSKIGENICLMSFVPVNVSYRQGYLGEFISGKSKDEKKAERVNAAEVGLITRHSWTVKAIEDYKKDKGESGLLEKYGELEKESK
jgi:hypothetical protein